MVNPLTNIVILLLLASLTCVNGFEVKNEGPGRALGQEDDLRPEMSRALERFPRSLTSTSIFGHNPGHGPLQFPSLFLGAADDPSAIRQEDLSLSLLLVAVVRKGMRDCDLGVVYDEKFENSVSLERVMGLPNPKQVIKVSESHDFSTLLWSSFSCRGYVFLLDDLTSLLTFADLNDYVWDYDGRYLVTASSKSQLELLSSTTKGMKTEYLIGVVKYPRPGAWGIYRNQVIWTQGVERLTTWNRKNFTTSVPLYNDHLRDLRGKALTVVTFLWEPSVIYKEDANGGEPFRYGRDVRVIQALARAMNFTLKYTEPPPGELWGNRLDNGSWTGLFGFLQRGDADLGVGNTFVSNVNGRMEVVEFTIPYDADVSCFLGTRPPPLPRWERILYPFKLSTWLTIAVGLVLSGPILLILASTGDVRGESQRPLRSFIYTSLYTYGLHLKQSQPLLPVRRSTQVFVSFLWLYAIIIVTGYSSNLTAFLTVARQPPSIDTLKELYASGLHVAGLGYFFGKALELSKNQYLRGLSERYDVHTDYADIWTAVRGGEAVNLESRKTLQYLVTTQFSSRGITSMRIIKECFSPHVIGVTTQRGSPLRRKFDKWVMRMVEAGLVQHWFLDSLRIASLEAKEEQKLEDSKKANDGGNTVKKEEDLLEEQAAGARSITLDHMQGIFFFLFLGYVASGLVLVGEVLLGRQRDNHTFE